MITGVKGSTETEQVSGVYIFNENDTRNAPVLKWLIGRRIFCPRCGCDRDGQYGITRIARASETDAWFFCQIARQRSNSTRTLPVQFSEY